MIITIKGADFSTKNIGTLSTWTILTNLGSGATYSGNRLVDKDGSLSATIVIADGYELGSAGVSVMMGSTNVTSSAATVRGNTITISIATVTGNVTIKVPTLNTDTGEEDGGDEETWTEILSTDGFTWQATPTSTGAKFGLLGKPISANTSISVIDIIQNHNETGTLNNVNIYVGNADNGEITEHIVQNQSVELVHSSKVDKSVARFKVNKVYNYNTFIMLMADRTVFGEKMIGVFYAGGGEGSTHYFGTDTFSVGDTVSANSHYIPYVAVYSY